MSVKLAKSEANIIADVHISVDNLFSMPWYPVDKSLSKFYTLHPL